MLFDHRAIAQIIVERDAGVVDEDIERCDFLDCRLNLRSVRDVERQRRDTRVGMRQRLARSGIDAPGAALQCFVHKGSPDTAIGSGDKNCFACDVHFPFS